MNISDVIIVASDYTSANISGSAYFRYDGNTTEAQEYFDKVFLDHNGVATVNIESVEEQYIFWKAFFFQEFKAIMPIFIMIILAIFINTYQLTMLNCEINDKKYAILKSEGSSTIAFILDELKVIILLLFIAETILYKFMDISLGDLAFIIVVYLAADVLVLWVTTSLKMRHFTERLR